MITSQDIERDPSLADEANLAQLLKSIIEVREYESCELEGGYFATRYDVTENATAFEATRAIAKHNQAAFTDRIRHLLRQLAEGRLDSQVTASELSPGTSYVPDPGGERWAKKERTRILKGVEQLFGTGDPQ